MKYELKRIDNNENKKRVLLKKEYVIIFILTIAVIVIFLSGQKTSFSFLSSNKEENFDYVTQIENRLENLLTDVSGVGKINAFITVDGTSEEIVLKNVESKLIDGVKTSVESVVLVGGKPYVTKTENPKIVGVVIVCEGADDLNVRLLINEIVKTTLMVDTDSVRIIKMK